MDRHEWTHIDKDGAVRCGAFRVGSPTLPDGYDAWYRDNEPAGREILRLAARVRELEGILADSGHVLFIHGPEMVDEHKVRAMRAHGKREERIAALEAEVERLRGAIPAAHAIGTLQGLDSVEREIAAAEERER